MNLNHYDCSMLNKINCGEMLLIDDRLFDMWVFDGVNGLNGLFGT